MNISSIHNKLVTKYMTQRNEELDTGNKYSVCPNHIGNLELILAYNSIPVFFDEAMDCNIELQFQLFQKFRCRHS